jgi:hypothetical protein
MTGGGRVGGFPRTEIGGLSVSRLVAGTNWWLGFSHQSKAKDRFIVEHMTAERIADVLEVFLREGVDALVGMRPDPMLERAVKLAEDRTGRRLITMGTPHLNVAGDQAARDENARIFDAYAKIGCAVCGPHQCTTDVLLDRAGRTIRQMDEVSRMIRERGMIPFLSTHVPETVVYADERSLDVESYIQIYNAIGFLMSLEVDWVHRVIQNAKRPVIAIKPLAAGKVIPLVGLAFAWSTIRERDMVCVGTLAPDEAREVIETSYAILEGRAARIDLQRTRSKASVEPAAPAR